MPSPSKKRGVKTSTSPSDYGPGKNKRRWTEEEDECLIEKCKELVIEGGYKIDNGFKSRFYTVVEAELKHKLHVVNIKAKSHIDNRLRHFKSVLCIVHDMMTGFSSSGFGWDPKKKTVTALKEVWRENLKSHPKVRPFRNRSCPYYENLCIIFGKDRATGKEARGFEELEEELKEIDDNNDESSKGENKEEKPESLTTKLESKGGKPEFSTTQVARGNGEGSSYASRSKKARASDNLVKGLIEAALILGRELRTVSSEISRTVGFDVVLSEKRASIIEELSKLELPMNVRHRATSMIASKPEMVDVFYSIPNHEKLDWVTALLNGHIA